MTAKQGYVEWPAGWYAITDTQGTRLEQELLKELGPKHALKNRKLRVIARRRDSDETLFELDNGQIAQVHLTWTGHAEPDPRWPAASVFSDLGQWRRFWISEME